MSEFSAGITRTDSKKKIKRSREEFHRLTALMKLCDSVNDFHVCEFLTNGPATRKEIADGTSMKWTTAHDTLTRLHIKGILKREVVKAGRGRPRVLWSLKL
ncbi:MAG: hypothetical protein ACFFD4_28405 [Candidatus Odinarchaeota archaeon]